MADHPSYKWNFWILWVQFMTNMLLQRAHHQVGQWGKKFHLVVVMAMVEVTYKFFVNVGIPESSSEGGAFAATALMEVLEEKCIGLPPSEPLLEDQEPAPLCTVGDDTFPMRTSSIKPYPQSQYNNRIKGC